MSLFSRKRRTLPEREPSQPELVPPDPSRVGGVAEAPFVRLPQPETLFATRAARLRALAEGHVLGDYLRFVAQIVAAQAAVVAALPPAVPPRSAQAVEHGMPPLSGANLAGLAEVSTALLDRLDLAGAPEAALAAADEVRAMAAASVEALAADMMLGAYPADRLAAGLFVAAALQVHLARLAAVLPVETASHQAEGACPICGGAPVSSLVVGWTPAAKARYCACSLCGTLWNHVRIRCTACGGTKGVSYYTIEGGPGTIGVETCTECRSYIKHMQQHEDPALEPVADDIASYALDLLAREREFRRSSFNPLFLMG